MKEEWAQLSMNRILRLRSGDFISAEDIESDGAFPVFGGNGRRGFTGNWNTNGPVVLIGRQGAHCGNVHIVEGKCWVSEHALRCLPEKTYDPAWLAYFLTHMSLNQFSVSAAQPGLSTDNLKSLNLTFPPLETQHRIAQFLDEKTARIDGLIEKKRALLDRLAEKRQALITRAVTKGLNPDAPMKPSGIDWLGDVPAHWQVLPLRRILKVPLSNGLFKRKAEFGEGTLLINVFDVYRPDLKVDYSELDRVRCDEREIDNYAVDDGDIFFVRSSLKMQGIAVAVIAQDVPEATVFECHLVRARCRQDRMLPRFLSFLLAAATYRARLIALAKTTTMTTIEQESLHSLHLTVPPLNEQTAIMRFAEQELERIDNMAGHIEASIQRLTEYRVALITAAVTGQLEVA
jgi:type I restriction enzyme S subunit